MSESQPTEQIIERVARAICAANGTDPDQLWNVTHPEPQWRLYVPDALAAISAIGETDVR